MDNQVLQDLLGLGPQGLQDPRETWASLESLEDQEHPVKRGQQEKSAPIQVIQDRRGQKVSLEILDLKV